MSVFFGLTVLIFLIIVVLIWYKKDGILFFCDFSRLAFIIWTLGLGLYDLALSTFYHPSIKINIVCCVIIANFFILSLLAPMKTKNLIAIYKNISQPNRKYYIFVALSLALGIFSFVVNLLKGQLRFFIQNTAARIDVSYSYFLNLTVVCSLFYYFISRISKRLIEKLIFFLLSAFSLFLIFCNMSRGPLVFFGIGVIIFEIVRYVAKNETTKLSIGMWALILGLLVLGVWIFGVIGDFRTKDIFDGGATSFYCMPEGTPSGLSWLYIYITSPLENARYILEEISVNNYTNFNNLFYPIIKFVNNLLGTGDNYAEYVESFNEVYPYLKEGWGLNVSSFIADAYADFSHFGIVVYVIIYDILAILVNITMKCKNLSNLSKALFFPIVIQIAIWSIFDNSIFRISAIWFDIVFILIWEIASKLRVRSKQVSGLINE